MLASGSLPARQRRRQHSALLTSRGPPRQLTALAVLSLLLLLLSLLALSAISPGHAAPSLVKRQLVDADADEDLRGAYDAEIPKDSALSSNLDGGDALQDAPAPAAPALARALPTTRKALTTTRRATLQPPPVATRTPSKSWSVSLSPYALVPNIVDRQWSRFYHVTPDCFLPVIPNSNGKGWIQFWSESSNYRTLSSTAPFFEKAQTLDPWNKVFGGAYNGQGYDNGGKWLMSVYRHPVKGGANLIGFYHAQDNYANPLTGSAAAWKSIGVAYSMDDGKSWKDGGQIITSYKPRPSNSNPQFGGNGDFGCVWDYKMRRWVLFYAGDYYLGMAISSDPDGKRGTWLKWAGPRYGFRDPGMGGKGFGVGVPQLADGTQDWWSPNRGLSLKPGSNPGIHFNVYLNKWIMIWQAWSDNKLYIAGNANISNPDGWETPRLLTGSKNNFRAWHATVVCGGGGSAWCPGNVGRLYYSDNWSTSTDRRDFVMRTITFTRND